MSGGRSIRRASLTSRPLRYLAGVLSGALLVLGVLGDARNTPATAAWDESYFPNLPLLTHEGKQVAFYDDLIRDKIVVINFIYANCRDICSLSTARMAQVQAFLGDRVGKDVHMYSISLDPANDTPAVLKDYAAAFGIAPGWTFLTGDVDEVATVRYKLGERSRTLGEHRADVVLGNARTGEWERTSSFQDIERLSMTILDMDPLWRAQKHERKRKPDEELATAAFAASPGQALFVKACAGCHTVGGGDLVGPDLEGVTTRRDSDWLARFLEAPDAMRAAGDPVVMELSARYPGVQMPNLGLSAVDIGDLLDYVDRRSQHTGEAIVLTEGHEVQVDVGTNSENHDHGSHEHQH